jgi:hypothetical protein
MPSSYTSRIRLEQQADGENPNSWGDILNQNVIELLDDAVGAYVTIGTSGVQLNNDITLTTNNGATDEARAAVLELNGFVVSASAANIVLPAVSKTYVIHSKVVNASSTGTLRVINAGATATGFTVPTENTAGFSTTIYLVTDGINVRSLSSNAFGLDVLSSIGEIETTTVDPITSVTASDNTVYITNSAIVDPKLMALSSTDIRYVNTSIGYINTIGAENSFTGQSYSPLVTVTVSDTSIFGINMASGMNFVLTLGADSQLRQPDNLKVGQIGAIYLIQDGITGGKTLSWANDYKFSGGTVPTVTTSISAVDLAIYIVRDVSVSASVTTAAIDVIYQSDLKR